MTFQVRCRVIVLFLTVFIGMAGAHLEGMKRTLDDATKGSDTVSGWRGMGDYFSRLDFHTVRAIGVLCPKNSLRQVCKEFAKLFSFSQAISLYKAFPATMTMHPRDRQKLHHYLITQDNVDDMKTILTANPGRGFIIEHIENVSLKDCAQSSAMRTLLKVDTKKGSTDYWRAMFADIVFRNNIEAMNVFLSNHSHLIKQLPEFCSGNYTFREYILGAHASVEMLEVLKPYFDCEILDDEDHETLLKNGILGVAADYERYDIVEYMLACGADPSTDYQAGCPLYTAVTLAHTYNDYRLLNMLKKYGVNVNGNKKTFERFCLYDSPVTRNDSDRFISSLLYAVDIQDVRLVHALLELGASTLGVHDLDYQEVDILEIARLRGNSEIIQALTTVRMREGLESRDSECSEDIDSDSSE